MDQDDASLLGPDALLRRFRVHRQGALSVAAAFVTLTAFKDINGAFREKRTKLSLDGETVLWPEQRPHHSVGAAVRFTLNMFGLVRLRY